MQDLSYEVNDEFQPDGAAADDYQLQTVITLKDVIMKMVAAETQGSTSAQGVTGGDGVVGDNLITDVKQVSA